MHESHVMGDDINKVEIKVTSGRFTVICRIWPGPIKLFPQKRKMQLRRLAGIKNHLEKLVRTPSAA